MTSIYHNLKIFQWLDTDIINTITWSSETRTYIPWEVILEEWEHPNGEWYIIINWAAQVTSSTGIEHTLWAGDIFWEMALLSEEVRSASVVAVDELDVIVLSKDSLFEIMWQDDANLSKKIMKRMEENLNA